MQINFAKRVNNSGERIYKISVPASFGRRAFYHLAVSPLKEAAFLKACKEGAKVTLTDFGTVVESGYVKDNQGAENGN